MALTGSTYDVTRIAQWVLQFGTGWGMDKRCGERQFGILSFAPAHLCPMILWLGHNVRTETGKLCVRRFGDVEKDPSVRSGHATSLMGVRLRVRFVSRSLA